MTEHLSTNGTSAMELTPVMTVEQSTALSLQLAMEVLTMAKVVVVKDEASYRAADDACASIKTAMKKAELERDGWVRPLNTQVSRINAMFSDIKSKFTAALDTYRGPMSAYQTELARLRKVEADRVAAEEAKLKAEALEAQRVAREALELAQKEAAALKAKAAELDPFDAILAEEEAATAQAQADAAAEAVKQSIRDSRSVVAPSAAYVPKVTGAGSKTYEVWSYEITDPGLVPLTYRPIDESLIARDVRALKGETQIPGIRVFYTTEVK